MLVKVFGEEDTHDLHISTHTYTLSNRASLETVPFLSVDILSLGSHIISRLYVFYILPPEETMRRTAETESLAVLR